MMTAGVRTAITRGWYVVFVVGAVVVLASAALTFWAGQRALIQIGDIDLAIAADRVARAADVYIARVVTDLATVTTSPTTQSESAQHTSAPRDGASEKRFDEYWEGNKSGDTSMDVRIQQLLESELSLYFKRIVRTTGTVVREIALADRHGRLIAASVRTDDYLQDDDTWWPVDRQSFQACSGAPVACARFRDVRWDESAGAFGVDVILPVVDNGTLVGVLKAVVDPIELGDVARISNRFFDVSLRKRDGQLLLEKATERIFTDGEVERWITRLRAGGETVVPRPSGNIAVRALTGPMGDYWIAVAAVHPGRAEGRWMLPGAWLGLTIIALLITGWAGVVVNRPHQNTSNEVYESTGGL